MLQNTCQLQEDTENLGKRSVDGSEAISSQWEFELGANIENLNNLTIDNSVLDSDKNKSTSDLQFHSNESAKSNNFVQELNYKFLQDKDNFMQNLNQSKKLLKDLQMLKSSFVNTPLKTYFEDSNSVKSEIIDSVMLNKHKSNLKNNISKSLNNTPTKTNILTLGSKVTEKGIRQSIAKYVPNNIFNFGFSNNKSQSNSNVNLSLNLDTSSIEKHQSLCNIVDHKTENFKFDITDLKYNTFKTKETNDNGLNVTKQVHDAQLNSLSKINLQSMSNSTQFLSPNASSLIKVKSVVNLSSENCLNRNLIGRSESPVSKSKKKQLSVNELPLLSLFEEDNSFVNSKNKSLSMINLDEKQNFIWSNDLRLNHKKTLSVGKLANLKDDSFFKSTK